MPAVKRSAEIKETLLGVFLLSVLTAIALWVFFEQYRFFPLLREQALPLESGGFPAPETRSETRDGSVFSRLPLPENLEFLSDAEVFSEATLSDKIDGKAELYLGAGFVRLETCRFRYRGDAGDWLEAFLYEMDEPQGAFSVYSQQKRDGALPVDLGKAAYQTSNALFIALGRYYMELVASSENPGLQSALYDLGKVLTAAFPEAEKTAPETHLFPKEGLDPGSIVLIAADAFGFEKLDKVFTAEYQVDGSRFTAFVSRRADAREAQALAETYHAFLLRFDAQLLKTDAFPENDVWVLSVMGETEVIFSQGFFLAGVHQAPDKKRALDLANRLNNYLIKLNENN